MGARHTPENESLCHEFHANANISPDRLTPHDVTLTVLISHRARINA